MQFKYPELLWALFLLLIPIFIHLFQLRRFKKTPFTNVRMLQKVVAESRRSNMLKKWLLLFTRLLLLAAFIIAFAQPFSAEKTALTEKETVIYLDDSFSMQAKTDDGTLLNMAVQELIKYIPRDQTFSLFTNEKVYKGVTLKDIQNDLLTLPYTAKQLDLNDLILKAGTFFGNKEPTIKDLIIISDFQQRMASVLPDTIKGVQRHLVQLVPDQLGNTAIDTVYIGNSSPENIELTAILSNNSGMENTPVSLFNDEKLIAKTSAVFETNKKSEVSFSVSNQEVINGKIEISDKGLTYDNQLYFNINQKEKIKVLAISKGNSDYLKRIFTNDEFQLSTFTPENLNYGLLETQNLIVLNELNTISNALQAVLKSFRANGGSLVIVPSNDSDLVAYNQLLINFFATSYLQRTNVKQDITDISFSHPLYTNVFEKKVTNFQYPTVSGYYRIKTGMPKVLSFQNKDAFLTGTNGLYIFTASIATENSSFKNSPLIVPSFYNMGINSLKLPRLYNLLGNRIKVDVPVSLSKDNVLKVTQQDYKFIPQQQSLANKVTLTFNENPVKHGIYSIMDGEVAIKNISFNYGKEESELLYLEVDLIDATTKQNSIRSLFEDMEKNNRVTELWKWFVILALLFVLVEILIQKYLK
ncbi:MAG: BatA domain-containing protein [Saonia sp.]